MSPFSSMETVFQRINLEFVNNFRNLGVKGKYKIYIMQSLRHGAIGAVIYLNFNCVEFSWNEFPLEF